jgi:4-amino-4-deoxy-L-arabinose transferase-like glycosyltransferase
MDDISTRVSRPWVGAIVFLYGTLIAAIFTFMVYTRQGVIEATVDLNGFGAIARNLARGDGFTSGYGPTTRRAPLYPLVAGALLKVFGNDAPGLPEAVLYRPLLAANCVFLGLTCLAVWLLARRIFDQRVALVAAGLCPLLPQSLRYVGMTEVEPLMGLWIVLLALSSHVLLLRPRAITGVAFGATAALATLTKPVALLYPFAFLPLAAWHWWKTGARGRDALTGSIATVVCFVALLVPWSLRNMAVTGGEFKSISSNAPGEFLRGYLNAQSKYFLLRQDFGGGGPGEKWDPEANIYEENLLKQFGVPFYRTIRRPDGSVYIQPTPPEGATSARLELEKDRIEGAEMKRRLLHEPGLFLRKFVIQFATFWYVVETRFKSVLVGGMALVMLALSIAGTVRAHREGAVVWPVLCVVLYFNAFYAAFLAFARYSMPLFPTLSVLAAGGLASLVGLVWSVRRGPAAGAPVRPSRANHA